MLWLRLFWYNNVTRRFRNRQAWKLFGPQWTFDGKSRSEFPFAKPITMASIDWAARAATAISAGHPYLGSPPPETPPELVRHLQGFQDFMLNQRGQFNRPTDEDSQQKPTYH